MTRAGRRDRRRRKPHVPGSVYEHPFETCFAVLMVMISASLTLSGLKISRIQEAPTLLIGAWTFGIGVGGALWLAGLYLSRVSLRNRWALETAGLCLVGSVWLTYAVTLAGIVGWQGALGIAQGVTIGLACIARIRGLVLAARFLRQVDRDIANES